MHLDKGLFKMRLCEYSICSNLFSHPLAELIYIFLFFLTNTSVGIFFIYTVQFPEVQKGRATGVSLDDFFQQHGITTRESEVIHEIYKGKTNQEIADTLFIAIQTVKDHTHRIYQKTQVKNRTQLVSLYENLKIKYSERFPVKCFLAAVLHSSFFFYLATQSVR